MWDKLEKLRQQYLDLNPDQVIDYEKFSMISIVYHSTKIEGCSLTESDTRHLLEKNITAKRQRVYHVVLTLVQRVIAKQDLSTC